TFDCPGAGTGANQGTIAGDINDVGTIAGIYIDGNGVNHGFVLADGVFTTFDAPGAGTGAGQGTEPMFFSALTPLGAITGFYIDANNAMHGFVRAPEGLITTFDVLRAGTGAGQGTEPMANNRPGAIAGYYIDANNASHGFLRGSPNGTITNFDAPGAGKGAGQGTFPMTNNKKGAIAGYYIDAGDVYHGFLRD